jgi:hypothetical protein
MRACDGQSSFCMQNEPRNVTYSTFFVIFAVLRFSLKVLLSGQTKKESHTLITITTFEDQ